MKEYLKIADVFTGSTIVRFSTELRDGRGFICDTENEDQAKYAAHAINSHDELVAEVERLREQVKDLSEELDDYKESSERWRSEAGYWQSIAEE